MIRSIKSFGIMGMFCLSMSVIAKEQCFPDPQSAYQYLIQQETAQVIAQKTAINSHKINLNTASEAELTQLKGIGSRKAQDIILYREMIGKFQDVDDLTKVKGIGKKTLEKNRKRLSVAE